MGCIFHAKVVLLTQPTEATAAAWRDLISDDEFYYQIDRGDLKHLARVPASNELFML
jgi:hypothetical protein